MKKNYTKFMMVAFALALSFTVSNAQVIFSENFDNVGGPTGGGPGTYAFPSGWTLVNNDGLTPDTNVVYVNDAWTRREDFVFDVADSCAFSTSWYVPAGQSDDWMISPAIVLTSNNVLNWNAVAYDPNFPDGYEVRISTTTPDMAGCLANPALFTIGAENSAWTPRSVDLQAAGYSGQTVYIAFRNNSNDKFLLLIDDIVVNTVINYDAKINQVNPVGQYTQVPLLQATAFDLGGEIMNNGLLDVTNANLTADVYDGSGVIVYSASGTAVPLLAAGTSAIVNIGSWTPAVADDYYINYVATITETDGDSTNNSLNTITVSITDSVYARDNSLVTGSLGIGAGNGGYLGQEFHIDSATTLSSISVYYTQGYTGTPFAVSLWDIAAGVPNNLIASTDTLIYPDDSARFYTIPISGGNFALAPGDYAVTAIEFDSTVAVGLTNEIFTAGRTWVNWPTNPNGTWSHNEDFGAAFAKTYVIRMNFNNTSPPPVISNDTCAGAVDINSSFGGPIGTVMTSGPYNDNNATANGDDPATGFECFGEPDGTGTNPTLDNTLWFTFTGDGNNYFIETGTCAGVTDYIDDGDTQFALYTGVCGSLVPVKCNEDGPNATTTTYPAGFVISTIPGTVYYLLVDGFNFNGVLSNGEFCILVSQLATVACGNPTVNAGTETQSAIDLCFGDTLTVSSAGAVTPNTGDYFGIGWAISSADITGSNDPLNDPSVLATYSFTSPAPATSTRTFIYDGTAVFITGGNTYYWTPVVFGNATSTASSPVFLNELTLDSTCTTTGTSLAVNVRAQGDPFCNVGINENLPGKQTSIAVYPSPARDIVQVDFMNSAVSNTKVSVTDITGRTLIEKQFNALAGTNSLKLPVKQLTAGVYFLNVSDLQGKRVVKFTKE
ncbi:MAG: choice-of-anchor J domain-containing protein [Bacteroidia bacterium]